MEQKTTLVVLAAGMGSRFGGLKQMEPFGPNGETIVDYSVFDAKRAGFDKAVIIIKKSIEKDFRELVGKRIEKMLDVDYAFQEFDALPKGYSIPEGRVKPYGTAHAILCTKDLVDTPFCVVNSDDFYGKESYKLVHDFLVSGEEGFSIAGYRLGNTLTENGTVNRGICKTENGYLTEVIETMSIDKNSGIPLDTLVSMNMWGLTPMIFPYLERGMKDNLNNMQNPLKDEFFL
ncbi:MAG: NTP transferase domain-containing protein, partial [Clostridia bacterium]|nr:NTP transferase domain-containing protein [Clostridia bacterium]